MADGFIVITNWDEYQHYKDRNPPWVKLHQNLMTSEPWVNGNDSQKALLIAMMLLAARHDNCIPDRPDYIRKVCYLDVTPDIEWLIEIGFCQRSAERTLRESPWASRHIPKAIKEELLAAQPACQMCGSKKNLEIDHIVPVSRGGKSEKSNLQMLCRSCNRKKRVSVADATQPEILRSSETETETEKRQRRKSARAQINGFEVKKVNGRPIGEQMRLDLAKKGIMNVGNSDNDFRNWISSGELTEEQARKAGASL